MQDGPSRNEKLPLSVVFQFLSGSEYAGKTLSSHNFQQEGGRVLHVLNMSD